MFNWQTEHLILSSPHSGQISSSSGKLPPQNTHLPASTVETVLTVTFSTLGGFLLGVTVGLSTATFLLRRVLILTMITTMMIPSITKNKIVREGLALQAQAMIRIIIIIPQHIPQGSISTFSVLRLRVSVSLSQQNELLNPV